MQKVENRKETKRIVYEIIEKLELQREQWKHLPMDEQVKLGVEFLRNKLHDNGIKLECAVHTVLDKAKEKTKNEETKKFFELMGESIGTKGIKFE
ncbi:MAG: hypothetical protein QXF56_02565 [Candidatus Micrarchaeia archaeon]